MKEQEILQIKTVTEQREDILAATLFAKYEDFMDEHFYNGNIWLMFFNRDIRTGKVIPSKDHFKWAAIVGTLCAQYGFEFFDGHMDYLRRRKIQRPFSNPWDLLVTGVYLGKINKQAREIKEQMLSHLPEDPLYREGIWGIDLDIQNGLVVPGEFDAGLLSKIRRRVRGDGIFPPLPILLPNPLLQDTFAKVKIDRKLSNNLSYADIERDIIPQLLPVNDAFCDLKRLFYDNHSSYESAPFYSLPHN